MDDNRLAEIRVLVAEAYMRTEYVPKQIGQRAIQEGLSAAEELIAEIEALQADLRAEREKSNRLEGLLSQALHGKARGIR
jgi:seryl-tRNA synthetase